MCVCVCVCVCVCEHLIISCRQSIFLIVNAFL